MPSVEVETPNFPAIWMFVSGTVAAGAGVGVGLWCASFWPGLFVYLLGLCVLVFARHLWLIAQLPEDARPAAHRVLAWFREKYSAEPVEGLSIRAVEPDRFVVGIWRAAGRHGPRRYFSITRSATAEITELEAKDWLPDWVHPIQRQVAAEPVGTPDTGRETG